jgi:exodeoxyribonuclease V beta subunit
VLKIKEEQMLFSYDDLITKLHNSIKSNDIRIALQKKYKAVFIDEFQDTDKKQYEIFNKTFHNNATVFYIGDPKQSIYAFRGADMDTYLDAKKSVNNKYTIKNNFRSTEKYINEMNNFFKGKNYFIRDGINYIEVLKGDNKLGELTKDNNHLSETLTFHQFKNAEDKILQTAFKTIEFLNPINNYNIVENKKTRSVTPSDIGILVATNKEAVKMKKELDRLGVPAITIDATRIFDTNEAKIIVDIIKAMFEPNKQNVSKAILNTFTNRTKNDLLSNLLDKDIEWFKGVNKILTQKGIFQALKEFLKHYDVEDNILNNSSKNSNRIISNIFQINELLHKKEKNSKLLPKELIHWFLMMVNNDNSDSIFTQRLESDSDAVRIMTIHKSKGLAFNIVIATSLNYSNTNYHETVDVKYKNKYCFSLNKKHPELIDGYNSGKNEENRRLIYVTLTRAVYMCCVLVKPTKDSISKGSLAELLNKNMLKEVLDEPQKVLLTNNIDKKAVAKDITLHRNLHQNLRGYSFSKLNKYESKTFDTSENLDDEYDEFIFNGFPRGSLAGNFMHSLFEEINFTATDFLDDIIKVKLRYSSVFSNNDEDNVNKNISTMLNHVLNAQIDVKDCSLKLSQIENSKKLVEMGFNYKLSNFETQKLIQIIDDVNLNPDINDKIQGFMSGFIDLLFEHEGKYYILDWKSNYLGHSVENYTPKELGKAVIKSNYHMQYYIYSVATKLYLQNIIDDFDYNKHFGGVIYVYTRGCRADKNTGIFYTMPDKSRVDDLEKLMLRID